MLCAKFRKGQCHPVKLITKEQCPVSLAIKFKGQRSDCLRYLCHGARVEHPRDLIS